MNVWLSHHFYALLLALKRLSRNPFPSFLSIIVIGIALSLPAGGYMLLGNLQSLSGHISGSPQLSLFLSMDSGSTDLSKIGSRLKQHPQVSSFNFIPKDSALEQLKQGSGLADVVDGLSQNPLPDAFVINAKNSDPVVLESLRSELQKWPKVDHVQLDSVWAKRLDSLLNLGQLAVLMLATLLSFALVAVTFNTIRLQILTRRDEIEVSKLIGASNGFIRRPFLYFGAIQGMTGGIVAWLIIALGIYLCNDALADLASLYTFDFRLQHLSSRDCLSLLLFSTWLGWVGAWLSVTSHLSQIEPR